MDFPDFTDEVVCSEVLYKRLSVGYVEQLRATGNVSKHCLVPKFVVKSLFYKGKYILKSSYIKVLSYYGFPSALASSACFSSTRSCSTVDWDATGAAAAGAAAAGGAACAAVAACS